MSAPKRIQLRRSKGWRKPEGAVVVSRPSKWGNPIKAHEIEYEPAEGVTPWMRQQMAVAMFRQLVGAPGAGVPGSAEIRAALRGYDLACWCALDAPCHADVLLEIANSPSGCTREATG